MEARPCKLKTSWKQAQYTKLNFKFINPILNTQMQRTNSQYYRILIRYDCILLFRRQHVALLRTYN